MGSTPSCHLPHANAHSVPQALKGKKRRCRNTVKEAETSICRENSTTQQEDQRNSITKKRTHSFHKKRTYTLCRYPSWLCGIRKGRDC